MATAGKPDTQPDHGALMDSVYRGQRHIYDITRKYFLFGRDRMIAQLDADAGASVLEIGCGTGRNLAIVARRWPQTRLHGIDISREMLASASARLGTSAIVAQADATLFAPQALLGRAAFNRLIFSYVLSMIPDWQKALDHAATLLAPGGSLHVIDFGNCRGLPAPIRAALRAWLARFHVTPRGTLADHCAALASGSALHCSIETGPFGYYQLIVLRRPAD
jgi:S-adenosylmethionine-diacylgycerolhomoserine-N-methlytransferase